MALVGPWPVSLQLLNLLQDGPLVINEAASFVIGEAASSAIAHLTSFGGDVSREGWIRIGVAKQLPASVTKLAQVMMTGSKGSLN